MLYDDYTLKLACGFARVRLLASASAGTRQLYPSFRPAPNKIYYASLKTNIQPLLVSSGEHGEELAFVSAMRLECVIYGHAAV